MAPRLPVISRLAMACRPRNLYSRLLQLPLELIFIIAKFLSPVDLVLLAQTSRSLRAIFQNQASATKLSSTEYLSFLAGLVRDKPEEWVCENCMTLHPIVKRDTPAAENHVSSCPYRHVPPSWLHQSGAASTNTYRREIRDCRDFFGKKVRHDTRLCFSQIRIEHRHIQLALKYTRLQERKYNSYLRALLKPYQDKSFKRRNGSQLKTHYSAHPKIVASHDGNPRFLLLSTWRYHRGRENITFDEIGRLKICPHIELDPRPPGFSRYPTLALRESNKRALQEAMESALETQENRQEKTGACARCATDFSVQLGCRFLDLYVWQDFGPEGSPVDLAWETQRCGLGFDGVPNLWSQGPALHHEPGSIRKLYEEQ
ncbi:hypothetical protein F4680DRAFT_445755 [Xylaria scruposa]|nr:hypothetical protein F4680DRAFT_445755 [Xylaria scruposa]